MKHGDPDQRHVASSKAVGWLLGMKTFPAATPTRPAPYMIEGVGRGLFAVLYNRKSAFGTSTNYGTHVWCPYSDDIGWPGLIWAYKHVGIPTLPVHLGAAGCTAFLVKVLTSGVLRSAINRLNGPFQEEGETVGHQ